LKRDSISIKEHSNGCKRKTSGNIQRCFDDDEIELFDEMTSDDVEDWDSLSHDNLILKIEKEFGVKFTADEITKTKNVGQFIDIINEKIVG